LLRATACKTERKNQLPPAGRVEKGLEVTWGDYGAVEEGKEGDFLVIFLDKARSWNPRSRCL
jgi:hypothetical protein